MNILLVNRWFPPYTGFGGVASYNFYLAHALQQQGHQVSVLAARWSKEDPELQDDGGIKVFRLLAEHHARLHRLPFFGRYMRPLFQWLYSGQVAGKITELEQQTHFDLMEFAEVNAEAYGYLRRRTRRPVVVRCHTPTFVLKRYYTRQEMPFDTRLTTWMEKACIRRADRLTAPSCDMAQTIARECGLAVDTITVIPNGLDPASFTQPAGEPGAKKKEKKDFTILHVGRLERAKGIEILACAIPPILRRFPHVRFVFVGDDRPDGKGSTWIKRLSTYFQEEGVADRVILTGPLDPAGLVQWYRQADLAVVPSVLYESFSYTCAQAMAAGLPLVATRIGGIPETVGVGGILVPPGDVDALVEAIQSLVQNPGLRTQMGQAGQERVEKLFKANLVAQRMVELYSRL